MVIKNGGVMNNDLRELFIEELEDMLSSENQIIETLPQLIKLASSSDLKDALKNHLEETKNQVRRIDKIFKILNMAPSEKFCKGMAGILKEGHDMVQRKVKSPVLDAAIISACQKVEHYEIGSYGTLRSFAETLELGREVTKLLQENLDEEGAADKKLTKIAEGGIFKTGINVEALEVGANNGKKHRK